MNKNLNKFALATYTRENLRSQSVKIFCVLREFLLKVAKINDLGDDIFMLYFDEVMSLLNGEKSALEFIKERRINYNNYMEMPQFPNLIYGRFEPASWIESKSKRMDYYRFGESYKESIESEIKGFAGASGIVTGKVRVLKDLKDASELKRGEILVTTATNVCDMGFFHLKKNRVKEEYNYIVETICYNELISREYKVYIGKTYKGEVDFIAEKGQKKFYIQATYMLNDDKVIQRKFGAYDHIDDNYPKYVISLDRVSLSRDGIIHINLIAFLIDRKFLEFPINKKKHSVIKVLER